MWHAITLDAASVSSNSIVTIENKSRPTLVKSGKYRIKYERKGGNFTEERITITLTSVNGPREYTFRVEGKAGASHFEKKKAFVEHKGIGAGKDQITFAQLDSILVIREETRPNTITSGNIEQTIKIKDGEDKSLVKLQRFKEVKQKVDAIRAKLSTEKLELLDKLLISLVSNKLKSIDLSVIRDRPLKGELEALVAEYSHDLGIEISLQELLKKITLEANYQRVIAENKYLEVANTMNLLRDAMKHLKTIEGKPASFFIGNTGAGKSTAVGFLLGANIEVFTNAVGDKVLRYKSKEGQDESKLPKIGQSLGESETLYTTGYVGPKGEGIADCPGFNDTRGSDFELCTNLSIDQAIARVGSIKSVVAVAPAAYFLNDRGNPVLSLIETVRDKFPFAFSKSNPQANSHVFLLITKGNQIQSAALAKLQDGTRFAKFAQEAQAKIAELSQRVDEVSPFQLESLKRRKEIWGSLHSMLTAGRVHFIDVRRRTQRKQLLTAYTGAPGKIDKALYSKAMDDGLMQQKFGKCVEMSANTWKEQIFDQFLEKLPHAIAKHQSKIDEKDAEITETNLKITHIATKLDDNRGKKDELAAALASDEIPAEFQQRFQHLRGSRTTRVQQDLAAERTRLASIRSGLSQKTRALGELQAETANKTREKTALIETTNQLGIGTHTEKLWEMKFDKEDDIQLRTWKSNAARLDVHKSGRETTDDDFTRHYTQKAKDFDGPMVHEARISKSYRIVPTDPAMRSLFQKSINDGGMSATAGNFTATLTGKHFKCDLGVIAEPTGKKVRYGFESIWKKGRAELPWIKLTHSIPKADFNEAKIIRNQSRINTLTREISDNQSETTSSQARLTRIQQEQRDSQAAITRLQAEVDQIHQDDATQIRVAIQGLLTNLQEEDAANAQQKVALEGSLGTLSNEIKAEKALIKDKQKQRVQLAVVAKTEWDTGVLLKNFAELVLGGAAQQGKQQSTVTACKTFLQVYNTHAAELLKQCNALLGLAPSTGGGAAR
ncbi:hypothetical protein COB21_05995 [Candidatus Aerophobetes bacterium]|uniref:G domain-containing protein n=1 Tax=Aerophobetes bacterium TaxID=2030807 RepID=A0A2A4WXK6_UNCAE|nr:MAG: hypothetical protein COB21_05995 [Candidatus Aerophobetes bacterium]